MKKIVKKNIKSLSFHQLCEAIEAGDDSVIDGLDEFAGEAPEGDADFTDELGDEGADELTDDTEADAEGETEEDAPATVTVEIDPNGSLADALHAILDVIEGGSDDEMVEDDMADDEGADEASETEDEGSDDEMVEDDTDETSDEEEECESEECEKAEEDEESIADSNTSMVTAGVKQTDRKKDTPAVNRKPTADADLGTLASGEGEAAGVKPLERKKQTPAVDRSKTAKTRITAGKRLTDIGK